jgi:hypothetical protein
LKPDIYGNNAILGKAKNLKLIKVGFRFSFNELIFPKDDLSRGKTQVVKIRSILSYKKMYIFKMLHLTFKINSLIDVSFS